MTSRLKHKLELDNVNVNSRYLNESFVQIGTPLPALSDKKKDTQEYVPVWQQEVRDEQGRRRFHGAFTGGFSAGYFNTVGSKEGWAPSEFKSSRNNRANKVQKPEDFMDDEDLEHLKSDRKLENTETFQNDAFAGTKEELSGRNLPSALESLIAPARSSIGQKLLQKLGWRPGQGIGPRVTLRKLRLQDAKLGKATAGVRNEELEIDGDDIEAGKHTFAPRDTKLLVYDAKDDRQGLGYEKGRGMGSLPGKRGHVIDPTFVEEAEDDPYAGPSTSSRHLAFDNTVDDDDDVVVMGGSLSISRAGLGTGMRSRDQVREVGAEDRWHDGRPVLSGFALDPLGVPADKWFAMPVIPPDWRPRPARVWGTTRKFDEMPGTKPEEKEIVRGAPGKPLTFEQRGAALGEEQKVSKAKSVYEYMSEKDRERLATLAASAQNTAAPPPLSLEPERELAPVPIATEVVIPPLSPRTASAALKGFIPYGDDPDRQERYRSYLISQTYNTSQPEPIVKPNSTFDAINKELEDFAGSARIFKPLSFAMSSRFTSGSAALAVSDLKQAKPGLHIFDAEKAKADMEKAKSKPEELEVRKDLTPREQAAQSGMYGKMTRESRQFYPVKLLCKRFGVPDPHPEGEPKNNDSGSASRGSQDNGLEGMALPNNDASWESKFIHKGEGENKASTSADVRPTAIAMSEENEKEKEKAPTSLADVGMAGDINQGRDTLTYTKPSIDIFKAIFASDDEDEDDEDEDVIAKGEDDLKQEHESGTATTMSTSYKDPFPAPATKLEGPVDLNTFKPVFKVRINKEEDEVKSSEKKKEKKDKDRKNKKRKGVLSFDVGDDGDAEGEREEERERKEKKKRKEKSVVEKKIEIKDDDGGSEGEWVEKVAAPMQSSAGAGAGRKGAADFM